MANYRATVFLSSHGVQSLGVCFDAGRFGSPKEETLVLAAVVVEKNLAFWLAPQVLRIWF
jgi:hypothetical protein